MFEGSLESKILFVSDFLRFNDRAENKVLCAYFLEFIQHQLRSVGISEAEYSFYCLHPVTPTDGKTLERIDSDLRRQQILTFGEFLKTHKANVIVPLGDHCLEVLCGLKSISKWHCSIVPAIAQYGMRKCLPLYHPEHVVKIYSDRFYYSVGASKLRKQMHFAPIRIPERKFLLNPPLKETLHYLRNKVAKARELSIDIETGRGQINTVGFAISSSEAIAIKTLPDDYSVEDHYLLWSEIAKILEGPQPKIFQNFIYEATWFARYGISLQNTVFDTMWAMKFLHPEFDKGLDNVGRVYTDFPYWKDDNDSWNNIKDWTRHLIYNCKDTTGTFEAYKNQQWALAQRKKHKLFNNYIMKFAPVIQEMCVRGLVVDPDTIIELQDKLTRKRDSFLEQIKADSNARLGREFNPRSYQQLRAALKDLGMKLPTSEGKETSDKKALLKLMKKYPKDELLKSLVGISASNKQLTSYIEFEYDRKTNKVHYQIGGNDTETGRMNSTMTGWGEGFNAQTIPKVTRKIYRAEPGKSLVQIDLSQAETRYVAWEAPEPALMQMLSEKRDVHRYVASKIFNKPEEFITDKERQLGKKSGHATNYDVGPRTFAEACLVEMDLVLTDDEARHIIKTYEQTFPGIRRRKTAIQQEIRQFKKLTTPIGRERYFYGRMDDATFREAYAYKPQSTIPDITNHLMLKLWEYRAALDVEFLLQIHDALLLQVPIGREGELAAFARDLDFWHPKIILPGGQLQIPVDVEIGDRWYPMSKI